ncbi:MAG: hypothetical protein ACI8WB_005742, partial [Phenylobacterium sp.]
MNRKYQTFTEFWPYYVSQHSKKLTRKLHFIGMLAFLPILLAGFFDNLGWLLLLPVAGYGFAWVGHFFVEHNKPATFTYPLWSFAGDFKMVFLMLLGKMD